MARVCVFVSLLLLLAVVPYWIGAGVELMLPVSPPSHGPLVWLLGLSCIGSAVLVSFCLYGLALSILVGAWELAKKITGG